MKITLKDLKELIKEHIQSLWELNVIDDTVTDYSTLSTTTSKLASDFTDEVKNALNKEIKRTLITGRGNWTHTTSLQKGKTKEFNYITSALAAIYKTADESEKSNIKNYLYVAYTPYSESVLGSVMPSPFALSIAKRAGITHELTFTKNIDVDYYMSLVVEGIYDAIEYALKNYNPYKGTFGGLLSFKAENNVKDAIGSKAAKTMFSGFGHKESGDEPLYGDEGENSDIKMSKQTSEEPYSARQKKEKSLAEYISKFIKAKIGDNKNYLEFFELFAEQGLDLPQMAEITGKEVNNLYIIKNRLEKYIDQFVKDGSFQRYIERITGEYVKFPKNTFKLYKVKDMSDDIEELTEISKVVKKLVTEAWSKENKKQINELLGGPTNDEKYSLIRKTAETIDYILSRQYYTKNELKQLIINYIDKSAFSTMSKGELM